MRNPSATNRANANVAAGKMKASYEDRFSIMLGDGKSVPSYNNQGCWITCHNDLRYMPNEAKKAEIDPVCAPMSINAERPSESFKKSLTSNHDSWSSIPWARQFT